MMYSTQTLTQVADCNILLAKANREKAVLTIKKLQDEQMTVRFSETAIELDAALQGIIIELQATEVMIASMPEGPQKDAALDRKTTLEFRKFTLENRRDNYGSVALLEKEMDLARVNHELTEVAAFITTIETRKSELGG